MNEYPRGTFQRKFRSMWFGKKKQVSQNSALQNSSRVKSLSTPSLNATSTSLATATALTSASNASTHQSSANALTNLLPPSIGHRASLSRLFQTPSQDCCPDDCIDCIQACECCNPPQLDRLTVESKMQRNFNCDQLSDKVSSKQAFSHTLPRNFFFKTPPTGHLEDPYVIVVSDLNNTPSQSTNLTVRTTNGQPQGSTFTSHGDQTTSGVSSSSTCTSTCFTSSAPVTTTNVVTCVSEMATDVLKCTPSLPSPGSAADTGSVTTAIPVEMSSSDSNQSSSASESGRGTLTSEPEREVKGSSVSREGNEMVVEAQYASVCKREEKKTTGPTTAATTSEQLMNGQMAAVESGNCKVSSLANGKGGSGQMVSDQADRSRASCDYYRAKYSQLYIASSRAPMPAVVESESFVSDCSTFREVVTAPSMRQAKQQQQQQQSVQEKPPVVTTTTTTKARRSMDKKNSSSSHTMTAAPDRHKTVQVSNSIQLNNKHLSKQSRMNGHSLRNRCDHWKGLSGGGGYSSDSEDYISEKDADEDEDGDGEDDCSSLCTAEISVVGKQRKLKEHILGIQTTYEDLMKRLTSAKGHREGRRGLTLGGSINSLPSKGSFEVKAKTAGSSKNSNSNSTRQVKMLEEKVTTLAQSVARLSSEVNQINLLREEVTKWKKEYSSLQQQMSLVQMRLESMAKGPPETPPDKVYSSVKKASKISK